MKLKQKATSTFNQYKRVLKLLKWPTLQEFKTISKVTVVGLIIVGALGFLVTILLHPVFS